MDVLVAGAGPAGRALAGACAALGLRTALVDPAPERPWRSTYGAWAGELPTGLPDAVVGARVRGRAVARSDHHLGWDYVVLATDALRAHLDEGLSEVAVHRGRVVALDGRAPVTAHLADGTHLPAATVVDATGHGGLERAGLIRRDTGVPPHGYDTRAGRGSARQRSAERERASARRGPARGVAAEQTAYGVVVPAEAAAPLVGAGEALFMDWRADHGEAGWPTFLYGVPYGDGTVLLEETSLARRPGLPLPDLRRRLHARLARHGVRPPSDAPVERVRFPLDLPRPGSPGLARVLQLGRRNSATRGGGLAFGAAAPLVHPATGFSVATALSLAPALAAALAGDDPERAAGQVLWPRAARAVHTLRHLGLEALLRMPPERVPDFFEAFLGLPAHHRWSYLTARSDLAGVLAAMGALFGRVDWAMRARLVGPAMLPRSRPLTTG